MSTPGPRDELQKLKTYVPGKSKEDIPNLNSDIIKLSSNENPLGSSVPLSELNTLDLSLYPQQSASELILNCAKKHSVNKDNIILGNGSDEIFQFICAAYLNPGDEVLSSEHTFAMYEIDTLIFSGSYIPVKMTHYAHDLDKIKQSITDKTKIIFLANPNNPTGTYSEPKEIINFISQVPPHIIVVIDEAYGDYVIPEKQLNSKDLISQFPNLIITRTFSKLYGLAGLRIGYGMGPSSLIDTLQKVRPPFNVNSAALISANKALSKTEFVSNTIQMNNEGKALLYTELNKLKDYQITFTKTEANFICIHTPLSGEYIAQELMKTGIIIRSLERFGLPNAVRVTIGSPDQNQYFLNAFKKVLADSK